MLKTLISGLFLTVFLIGGAAQVEQPAEPTSDYYSTKRVGTVISAHVLSHIPLHYSSARVALEMPLKNQRAFEVMGGMIYWKNEIRGETKPSPELRFRLLKTKQAAGQKDWIRHGLGIGMKLIRSDEEYLACTPAPWNPNIECWGEEKSLYPRSQLRTSLIYTFGKTWNWDKIALALDVFGGLQHIKESEKTLPGVYVREDVPLDISLFGDVAATFGLEFTVGYVLKRPAAQPVE